MMTVVWFWILVGLVLVIILAYPVWPYSRRFGVVILAAVWVGYLAVSWPWAGPWH
jgi:hypothetical protein